MHRTYLAVLVILTSSARAQITAVPPSLNRGSPQPKAAVSMMLPNGAPSRQIALGPLTPDEQAQSKTAEARRSDKPGAPLQVGIARSVPANDASIRLADLPWQDAQGGGRAARIDVTSNGASALRVGIVLRNAPAGLTLRFAGSAAPSDVFGPIAARDMPSTLTYWSPIVDGATATIELALPSDASIGDATVELSKISHLALATADFKAAADPFKAIGSSGSCEVDLACVSNVAAVAALQSTATAVVRIALTYGGSTFLCSGTLLNDAIASHTPHIFTANHCVDDPGVSDAILAQSAQAAQAAASVQSYWFFQAATCGDRSTPSYVVTASGAKLLARSFDYDWALLQLNDAARRRHVRRVARRAARDRRIGRCVASSGRRSHEVQRRRDNRLSHVQRRQHLHSDGLAAGRHRAGEQRRGILHVVARRHELRIARRTLWRQRVVHESARHRRLLAARQRTAAARAISDAEHRNDDARGAGRRVLQRHARRLRRDGESGRDRRSRQGRSSGLDSHRLPFSRICGCDDRAGRRESGLSLLRAAGVRRFAFLLRRSDRMQRDAGEVSDAMGVRKPGRVLHPAAGQDDRRVSGQFTRGLSLFQQRKRVASPLHRRSRSPRHAERSRRPDGTQEGYGNPPAQVVMCAPNN